MQFFGASILASAFAIEIDVSFLLSNWNSAGLCKLCSFFQKAFWQVGSGKSEPSTILQYYNFLKAVALLYWFSFLLSAPPEALMDVERRPENSQSSANFTGLEMHIFLQLAILLYY